MTRSETTSVIKDLLNANWQSTDVTQKDMVIRRGEPADLTTRFGQRNISIEVVKLKKFGDTLKKTLDADPKDEQVNIHVWQLVRRKTNEEVEALYDQRELIEQEIERIVLANERAIAGIGLGYVGDTDYVDDLESEPPALHAVLHLHCWYEVVRT